MFKTGSTCYILPESSIPDLPLALIAFRVTISIKPIVGRNGCKRCFVCRQWGLLLNSIKLEIHDKIEVGCLTPTKEEVAYDGETPIFS